MTFFLIGDGDRDTLQEAQDGRELTFFCHWETGSEIRYNKLRTGENSNSVESVSVHSDMSRDRYN